MAADEHPNRRRLRLESKMRTIDNTSQSIGRAVLWTPSTTIRGAHGVTRPTQRNLSAPELSRSANEHAMSAQEFPCAHSPFSFELDFGERKCVFASGNDQVFIAAQNFAGSAIEVDN